MTTTSSERRLHPVSMLLDLAQALPRTIVPLVLVALGTGGSATRWLMLALVPLTAAVLAATVVRYLRFTYRYEDRHLVVRSGLLFRNERRIPYVRIQTLDASQNIVHRALGVAAVYVQTGGGAEPEATLRVLPVSALEEMRARVHGDAASTAASPDGAAELATPDAPATAHPPRRTLLRLQPRDLLAVGFIENRGLVLIAGALALLQQIGQSGATERLVDGGVRQLIARWTGGIDIPVAQGAVFVVVLGLLLLAFVRVLSTVWALVRLYDFRLERVGDELHMAYGLFTRVAATIPLRRVQTIVIREGMIHRMLGACSLAVETAGGTTPDARAPGREPVAPILLRARLSALLAEIQPGLDSADLVWQPVHPRAFGRMLRSEAVVPLLIGVAAFLLVREWAAGLWVLLLAWVVVKARLRSRVLAWCLDDDVFAVRDGALMHTVRIARFTRLQVAALRRNPFDMRSGMATLRADTAGAQGRGAVVPYLPEPTAAELHAELVTRTAATGFTW